MSNMKTFRLASLALSLAAALGANAYAQGGAQGTTAVATTNARTVADGQKMTLKGVVMEKRPKVIESEDGDDVIAIRHMAFFALSFDHRIVDGADAERFLSFIKETLEAGQFTV